MCDPQKYRFGGQSITTRGFEHDSPMVGGLAWFANHVAVVTAILI
jgi:hypothetical protein